MIRKFYKFAHWVDRFASQNGWEVFTASKTDAGSFLGTI